MVLSEPNLLPNYSPKKSILFSMAHTKTIRPVKIGPQKPHTNALRMTAKPFWLIEKELRECMVMRLKKLKKPKELKPEIFLSGELHKLQLDSSNNPCPASIQPWLLPAMTCYRAMLTVMPQPLREK
jgi:hypothetical protein